MSSAQQDKAAKLQDDLARYIAGVRDNPRLSAGTRQRHIAKQWVRTRDQVEALRQEDDAQRAKDKQQLERDLFGLNGTADPSAAISQRDALDRASKLTNNAEASALLQRATLTGDDHLGKAILYQSVQAGLLPVIDQYAAAFPAHADKVGQLYSSDDTGQNLVRAFTYAAAGTRPTELARLTETQIGALVAEEAELGRTVST